MDKVLTSYSRLTEMFGDWQSIFVWILAIIFRQFRVSEESDVMRRPDETSSGHSIAAVILEDNTDVVEATTFDSSLAFTTDKECISRLVVDAVVCGITVTKIV